MDALDKAILAAKCAAPLSTIVKKPPLPIVPASVPSISLRTLVGEIDKLKERIKLLEVGMERVYRDLGIHVAPPSRTRAFPTIRECVLACSEYFAVPVNEILGHSRKAKFTHVRHVAMYLAKRMTLSSHPQIGRVFNDRDHSTILHGVDKIELNRKYDAELDHDITVLWDRIETKLKNQNTAQSPPGAVSAPVADPSLVDPAAGANNSTRAP